MKTTFVLIALLIIASCSNDKVPAMYDSKPAPNVMSAMVERKRVAIVNSYAHDTSAFTQGLVVKDGFFYESTGRNGFSSIRKVDIKTGKVVLLENLPSELFGEGMAIIGKQAYMLTWLNQQGLMFDVQTLRQTGTFSYMGEGWGLTTDGTNLYKSNGSNIISVHTTNKFELLKNITVTLNGKPLTNINELEWIRGKIWANIWQTSEIVVINPTTGVVEQVLDLSGLQQEITFASNTDVLNGIAYDSTNAAVYVTGKCWPKVFQITVE